jgi:hypothetical protein
MKPNQPPGPPMMLGIVANGRIIATAPGARRTKSRAVDPLGRMLSTWPVFILNFENTCALAAGVGAVLFATLAHVVVFYAALVGRFTCSRAKPAVAA